MTDERIAAAASAFGPAAADYELARPSYPPEALDVVVRELGVGPGARVLDLAAGTGKLTRLLAATGAAVTAVEPVPGMRARIEATSPDVTAVDGTAEDIPFPDASFDVVTVAQAFHWFEPAPALAEIARVLRPGGGLALIWNVRDERVPWVSDFTELVVEVGGGRPYSSYRVATAEDAVAGPLRDVPESGAFDALHLARFRNDIPATIDEVVDRAASTSFIAALPEAERVAGLACVRTLLEGHPDLARRRSFVFPHLTDVYWCRRR